MNQMDDSVKSGGGMEVSVSFGRFENDALSWEKWSSFSPNKYMDEIGSLSTPGSVAQKKAYFEAHYKKIATMKAQGELEQEMSKDDEFEESRVDTGFSDGDRMVEEVVEEPCITALKNVAISDEVEEDDSPSRSDEHGGCSNGFVDSKMLGEEIECAADAVEEAKDLANINVESPEVDSRNEAPQKESKPPKKKNAVKKQPSATKKDNTKLNSRSMGSKVITPTEKVKLTAETKKKVVSPAVKPSTPKHVKSASTLTRASVSQSSKKKMMSSAPPKIKNSPMMRESKKTSSPSLHMSLTLGPSQSLSTHPMTRKSLIMESMGDKDIVKRAFKSFQNHTNGSVSDGKPNVSSISYEPKVSSYRTPTEGKEGLKKDAEKRINQRSQLGSRSNPLSSGSRKSPFVAKKNPMPVSPATGLRSDDIAEKRKEFLKKLEAKSIARTAENPQPGARSRVGVEKGMCQRPTLNR